MFVDGKYVAALNGSAQSVEPGRAATVQVVSTDKFVHAGPYEYDFQTDLWRRPGYPGESSRTTVGDATSPTFSTMTRSGRADAGR